MNSRKYIVTSSQHSPDGTHSKVSVWDGSAPLGLGHPFRWVLEQTNQGLRVRDLSGNYSDFEESAENPKLKIPLGDGKTVELQPVRASLPPYLDNNLSGEPGRAQLFGYAGVRRTLLSCAPIHSAYVAYVKGKPVFTLYYQPDGLKIKTLLNGVRMKMKGQSSVMGKTGEIWQFKNAELSQVTITRGWYWWRFNFVSTPDGILKPFGAEETDSALFGKYLRRIGVALGIFALTIALWPAAEVKKETPVADNIKLAPKQKIFSRKGPAKSHPSFAGTDENSRAGAPADAAPAKNEKLETATPAPVAMPIKSRPTAATPPASVAKATPVAAPVAPKRDPKKQASEAAVAKAMKLRESLGGVLSAISKSTTTKNDPNAPAGAAAKSMTSGMASLAPTEVKPGFSGGGSRVSTLGGKGMGGKNGTSGAGIGYASSGQVGSVGAGGSFVSIGGEGQMVDEGLTKEQVGAVIHKHMSEIRYCHEAAMAQHPGIEGKVVMDFKINPAGIVDTATIQSTTLSNAQLNECVKARLKTWKFPRPKGGVFVSVSYPFLFKTLERD